MSIKAAILDGLEVLADSREDNNEKTYALHAFMVEHKMSVLDILSAFRDAAYCAQDVAKGGVSGQDFFGGTTHDDLHTMASRLDAARDWAAR